MNPPATGPGPVPPEDPPAARDDLRNQQIALVAALVAGDTPPPGFDPYRLAATRDALLRKRASEAAGVWPMLAAGLGHRWADVFREFAVGRPPAGPLRDGWDLARSLARLGELPATAHAELTNREKQWRYDGVNPPKRRLLRWR